MCLRACVSVCECVCVSWLHNVSPRLPRMGSPALHGTWLGESIDADLRKVVTAAHRLVWHTRVLNEFRVGFGDRSRKRKH